MSVIVFSIFCKMNCSWTFTFVPTCIAKPSAAKLTARKELSQQSACQNYGRTGKVGSSSASSNRVLLWVFQGI